MSEQTEAIAQMLERLMMSSFLGSGTEEQVDALHAQIEQLHRLAAHADGEALTTLAVELSIAASVGAERQIVCEHCQKAARLLCEYLETMRVNNKHHATIRKARGD